MPDEPNANATSAAFHHFFPPDVRRTAVAPLDGRERTPRHPRKDAHINPSTHRPHVLASDRSTRSNYGAGLLRFTQYCDSLHLPEVDRMPASEALIASFSASAAGNISSSALNNWLGGLHFWHTVNGAVWNGSDMLRHVRRGLTKLVPLSSKRAKRPPVTLEAMIALRHGLDMSNALDAAVWAVACIAFWCCCRLGELIIPSPNTFAALKHVTRTALPLVIHALADTTQFSTFHIPWTKTTGVDGADISITARNHLTCPLAAIKHHVASNASLPSSAPLFAFELADGGWSPLTRTWFLARCNAVWVTAGYPNMPGHAFRIGGATELLLQGVSPDIVATQGRWKSQAFLDYWRQIESILPLFIASSSHSSQPVHLQSAMDSFRRKHSLITSS
ncbi:hypothetical protein BJ138DRAFT_1189120 [Hygrophoropsis aurantiaca]|uniref:Uncharacterized protein n=1 Tax=Hygrophoropsis aurantiaca TaxID=72124 RepID=A0ACB7ZSN9_9AGAM|nr:hypothetical protein BJ138DRAFT_1189120 [Hygrophoropsis aurantiaca]